MSGEHTPTPWRYTAGETVFQVWGEGEIRVAATSWHDHLRRPYPLKAEAQANVALIVTAVNSHASNLAEIERLREVLQAAFFKIVGLEMASAVEANGWQWPSDAPRHVDITAEAIRTALSNQSITGRVG